MLKKRIITAVCLVLVFLLDLFFLPAPWFMGLIALVSLIAVWEWSDLSGLKNRFQRVVYCTFMIAAALGVMNFTGVSAGMEIPQIVNQDNILTMLSIAGAWWAIALLWIQGYPSSAILWGSRWVRLFMGLFVLLPCTVGLFFLHQQPSGTWLILWVAAIVSAADIFAYFSGRAFGKHKLAKNVSPGKTWEGVLGGVVACTALALLVAYLADKSIVLTLLIVVPTAFASVVGDLLESMVKRHRGIKDSGSILPGHGGVLDRIDGLTAAIPVFALMLAVFGW